MNILRKHWYDIGGMLSLLLITILLIDYKNLTNYQIIVWLSLFSLFLHQLEEYRIVGTFPGMVNKIMYKSDLPDRFPLNTNTSVYVNVFMGWSFYFLAALFAEKAIWLGIATILVSLGNLTAHTTVFNIKGKTLYNAGLATSWLLFAPCIFYFFKTIHTENIVTTTDYLIGIPLGIVLNVVGIVKLIDWFADKDTPYIFEQRNLLPED
ncbi:MAG: HXXEE domain-containing protein, partial [Cytophagales bacterium]